MVKLRSFLITMTAMVFATQTQAADKLISMGKTKSMICASCHGSAGISQSPIWPNLAGQKSGYLEKQLIAFRDGSRKEPTMSAMAKPLSDSDIKALAAYYASLK
ncbi:MAG: cytochrome c [Aliiglaciecola sp.]|uniref:c-type cytochrome n=1 Tax=Aliiglaciecola sp. TaxID=1872441 RepID=UPI00329A25A9